MLHETIDDIQDDKLFDEESPLVICEGCRKLVPRTNLCLYCGAPIQYKKNLAS
jgi:rRNA maturation endonuclease Nob1